MIKKSFSIFIFSIYFFSCGKISEFSLKKYTHFSIGTIIEITVLFPSSELKDSVSNIVNNAFNIIDSIDRIFYEGNKESYSYHVNMMKNNVIMQLPEDFYNMIKRSISISKKTLGYFDITVGTYLNQYSFGKEIKKEPDIDSLNVLSGIVGYNNLSLMNGNRISKKFDNLRITIGGIAKGYAVDSVKNYLSSFPIIKGAIINAGGDIGLIKRADGKKWKVGIRHPRKPGEIIGILNLSSESVATSGDYENYYIVNGKKYHHLLNPFTGLPSSNCQSVTVIAPNTELADALATALFVAGYEKGREILKNFDDVYAMWIDSSGYINYSDGFTNFLKKIFKEECL
ncbi:MAG: FAD:protein FMN transferase [Candidatus Marinimicrobia bacterium]|nr:FAD:protein FMN transferase [Candidatus Neomarinimicrobiota bacterium]